MSVVERERTPVALDGARRTLRALRLGAGYAALTGGGVLVGWLTHVPRLTDWLGSGVSALPTTAISAIGAGLALLLLPALLWFTAKAVRTHERTLRKSEADFRRQSVELQTFQDRYRMLFESLDEGFCTIRVLFDDAMKPIDYEFLEVNEAFTKQTGLASAKGRRVRELIPAHEQHWFDVYGRVAITGEAVRFESHAASLQRWFDVYAFRAGPGPSTVAVIFNDITARKRTEALLSCQKEALELVASGLPLVEVLDHLARTLEEQSRGVAKVAIRVLNAAGTSFRHNAGRPLETLHGSGGIAIDEDRDPCSRAVRTRAPVTVDDPDAWNAWPRVAAVAAAQGIRSCIVTPILGSDQRVRGAFAIYYAEENGARNQDRQSIEVVARTAALAIERAGADAAMRESEQRFRAMIDALPAAIYTTDAQGRLLSYNPAAVELSGRTPDLGSDRWCVTWKLFHPDGTPMPHDECPMAVALREGRPVLGAEAMAERPDGTRIWFQPYPTPFFDDEGNVAGGINMLVDITERKFAESATARLAAIVESSDDAIVSKSLDGVIRSWNKGAEKILGYTADEAIGKHISLIIPADRLAEEDYVLARLRRGEKIDHFETERQTKDGRLVSLSLTVSPLRDSKGRVVGASKVARDVTERKRTEAALAAHQKELEHRVGQVTRHLREALERQHANERLAALGTLASGLGHDIANMVLPMRARLEPLALDCTSKESRGDIEAIGQALTHLTNLSAGLRLMALDPGRHHASSETLDLRQWAREAAPVFGGILPRSVKVEWNIPERLGARIARHCLMQAVFNLVQNAGEALAARGEGEIKIAASALTDAPGDPAIQLTVEDNGPGMSPEVVARCFEPYFSTKGRAIATGMGLPLVRGLVQAAGGDVAIESSLGRGAKFTLTLPAGATNGCEEARERHRTAALTIGHARTLAVVRMMLDSMEVQSAAFDASAAVPPSADLWIAEGAPSEMVREFLGGAPHRSVLMLASPELEDPTPKISGRILRLIAPPAPTALKAALASALAPQEKRTNR
jgi:PAS domain S-box-containing protein